MNFLLLSVIFLFSVTSSTVIAVCNETVSTEDGKALADLLPLLPSITKQFPLWNANNVLEACCWRPYHEGIGTPYLDCQKINGVFRVVNLSISTFTEMGALPSSIGSLSALTFLDLSNTGFEGPIPQSWSQLTSLTKLNISKNELLEGTLDVLSNLRQLEYLDVSADSFSGDMDKLPLTSVLTYLDLSNNRFQGPIPQSWSQLTSLTKLNIGGNMLNGTLDVLSTLRKLEFLDVGTNSFSGEMDKLPLTNLTSLTDLFLLNNVFTGSFPSWFGTLPKLKVIDMGSNILSQSTLPTNKASWPEGLLELHAQGSNLTGPIPEILASLPFKILDLSKNKLTGSIPVEFGNMNIDSGTQLLLSLNALTGEIPIGVAAGLFSIFNINSNNFNLDITSFLKALCTGKSSTVLTELDISKNTFTGEIPLEISNCSSLVNLILSFNRLTGEIPVGIGDIPNLTILDLSNNQFRGNVPLEPSKLGNLDQLLLWNNYLTGSLPVFNCSSLTVLYAYNNSFTGPLPSFLANCLNLSDVQLQFNSLSGSISFFSYNSQLTTLNLASNNFTGSIPTDINWLALLSLNLSSNNFTGEIPVDLDKKAPILGELILSFNSLSGGIPSSLFASENLVFLDISYNNLNSSLDSNFLRSSSLTSVYIQGNNLFGSLPVTCFSFSPNLQDLDLRKNKLSGPLPSNLTASSSLITLNLAENSFSGPLPSLVPLKALSSLNISGNAINGSIPDLPKGLGTIDMSKNYLSGTLPSFGPFLFLTRLDVSSNQLSGSIASNFSNVAKLKYLDFSQNIFSGNIPAIYYNLMNLTYFNVSNNFLTGRVPPNLQNVFDYSNNSALCGGPNLPSCSQNPSPPGDISSSRGDSFSTGAIIGIAVGGGFLALVILAALLVILTARVRNSLWDDLEDSMEYSASLQRSFSTSCEGKFYVFQKLDFDLTIDDIIVATDNFSERCLLGRGGFGSVYRARLRGGEEYAVKRLTQESSQGDDEFQAEISSLGNVRHKNLVTLVASYYDPTSKECLLIYNFLSGGNLDSLLRKGVDWPTRLTVAIGVARGLKYLHHDCIPYIIHRDMKPGNILMDSYMEAHLSDFGLAKVVDLKKTHVSTKLLGTIGYLAPEYAGKGQASTKSDVFAYGVVLLQLVSGKIPTQSQMRQGMSAWAKSTPVDEVIDPSLIGKKEHRKPVLAVLNLGLACTARSPLDRPTMEEVLHTLENLDAFAAGVRDDRDHWRRK